MASSCAVGNLKKEFVKFLESSIEFYVSLIEQLQPNERSLVDGQSKRKVIDNIIVVHKMCLHSVYHYYNFDLYLLFIGKDECINVSSFQHLYR